MVFINLNNCVYFTTEFLNWKSNTNLKDCVLKDSLRTAVNYFIEGLEKKFPSLFVIHTLSKFYAFNLKKW